jgi:predicted metal-dependent HD superfamily phosphohydrolase
MNDFNNIKLHVIDKLQKGLAPDLSYHNIAHTLDVLEQAEIIAMEENLSPEDVLLLKVSVLYHDTGFIFIYNGHEEKSCEIARQDLPGLGFSDEQITRVCGMILATNLPQEPTNKLEEIICDADLDYIGRTDFFSLGEKLYQEFLQQKMVSNEKDWNEVQVNFLENHHYFTHTSKLRRETLKQQHLQAIKKKLDLLNRA